MASIKVDLNGDGIFDKDNDPLTLLPPITDETADGVLDVNLTAANSRAIIDGAVFQDAANVGSGTGNYNTFLALQDKNDAGDVETGFNAGVTSGPDPTPEDASNTEMDASKSNAILLGAIPIIIGTGTGPGGNGGEVGVAYYEFRTDLNENNNDIHPQLSLDQFKLFVGGFDLDAGPGVDLVDTFAELNSLTKVYDMDGMNGEHNVSVLMNEANSSGSGTDDYSVLVPVSNFGNADPATTYVYLFVEMGIADGSPPDTWGVSGGFHEWNLQNAVIIQGTKFNDANGNGVQDTGETGMAGVTIYIDNDLDGIVEATDNNGVLDAGEQFDVTDANGNYSFGGIPIFDADYTIHIREIVPDGAVPTTTLPVAVVIDKDLGAGTIIDSGDFPGLVIGNRLLTPSVSITKTASGYGDCADTAGETILYTIVVDNDGELTLTNVVLTDNFEGGGNVTITLVADDGDGILELGEVFRTGDTNGNNQMETTETWTYTYLRSVTQAQIDSNGGGDGVLTDVATVNADSANGSVTDNDNASVNVCQEPALSIDKSATVPGDCANVVGELISYSIVLDNIGNVALDNVVLEDNFEGNGNVTLTPFDDGDGILELGEVFRTGDTGGDGIMGVDETWTYTYLRAVTQEDIDSNGYGNGTLDNTATANADAVNSDEAADEVSDTANVNVCQEPALDIDKTASVPGDCANVVGELITYTIVLDNIGNVALDNVVLTDSFEGGTDVTITPVADDGDGILELGEVFLTGDTGNDGIMGVDETWTYSFLRAVTQEDIDSNGYGNGTLDNTATANADAVNSDEAADEVTDDASVNVCQEPVLSIDKSATVPGDCANVVGELITYTIVLNNIGNVALDNVVLTDSFEGGTDVTITPVADDGDGILELGEVFLTGDTGGDGIMGVDETWTYSFLRAVTQEDIDSNGYGNGTLDNTATANADAVNSDEAADEVTDDASVNVCRTIAVDLTKYVDVGFGFDDANTGPGPENVNVGGDVDFMITLENTGNVTLTAVDVVDTYLSDGLPGTPNLLVDDGALTAYALAHGGVLTGDDDDGDAGNGLNADGILQVGETWTITYTEAFDPLSFDPGAHLNTADVTTDEGATDEDSAYYFTLIDTEGPGVRTPGFWQNPNNGGQFWNGVTGDAKNDGGPCFPVDDLLRIDSDQDGDIDENDTGFSMHNGVLGLFIGDYDRDGVQDAGEDILFISRTDAMNLLSANTKAMNDMAVKIGRDAVATWLNYLAGNEIGGDPDASHYSPKEAINDAIDYLQTYAGVLDGGSSETWDIYKPSHTAVTSKGNAAAFAAGTPIHNALDEYNNFGTINGHEWAHDCDDAEFVQALTAYHSAHHDLF